MLKAGITVADNEDDEVDNDDDADDLLLALLARTAANVDILLYILVAFKLNQTVFQTIFFNFSQVFYTFFVISFNWNSGFLLGCSFRYDWLFSLYFIFNTTLCCLMFNQAIKFLGILIYLNWLPRNHKSPLSFLSCRIWLSTKKTLLLFVTNTKNIVNQLLCLVVLYLKYNLHSVII